MSLISIPSPAKCGPYKKFATSLDLISYNNNVLSHPPEINKLSSFGENLQQKILFECSGNLYFLLINFDIKVFVSSSYNLKNLSFPPVANNEPSLL